MTFRNETINEELVDIVNKDDQVISTSSKREAHKKGLLHRTVIAEVIDEDGKWILVKQAPNKQDAGQYVSPIGGHVSAGETPEEALKREAAEECGLTSGFSYRLIGKKIYNREIIGRKENHYFILYEITSNEKIVLNEESVGYEKFSKRELKKQLKDNPKKFGAAFHFVFRTFYLISDKQDDANTIYTTNRFFSREK